MPERTLNHFAGFAFGEAYWTLAAPDRARFHRDWLAGLRAAAARVDVYQVFPARADVDCLVWSALPAEEPRAAADFFARFARAATPQRQLVRPVVTLWGFTRPSAYGKGSSTQEIDPFAPERQPYLIVYPFAKTAEWYAMSRDARQGMMNEHIRIGRQYPEVGQLLLYAFGLQDHEFVVVYETADLARFSELVADLRATEARRFTRLDTPTFTAVYHSAEETLALWI